ncbi:hypothetical protein [Nostoc sp.]
MGIGHWALGIGHWAAMPDLKQLASLVKNQDIYDDLLYLSQPT